MSNGTFTTTNSNLRPLTYEDIKRVVQSMPDMFGKPDNQWTLVSPDGRMWRGNVQEMFLVLAPHHPLLKIGGLP